MAGQSRPSTLCEAFQQTARSHADEIALEAVGSDQKLTWSEYAERVRRIAEGISGLGVRRGHTVGLMMSNRPEFNLVDTAVMHLGAVPYSIYNTSSVEQIAFLLENADTEVVLCEAQFVERIRAAKPGLPHLIVVDSSAEGSVETLQNLEATSAPGFDFEDIWRSVRSDDPVTLIYTSGTTGNPKGVEVTHANILAQLDDVSASFGIRPGDRTLSYLPAAHIGDRVSTHYVQMTHAVRTATLSDTTQIAAGLVEVRPHFWFAVPRVWEKMKAALENAFRQMEGEQAAVMQKALALGAKRAAERQGGAVLNNAERAELATLDEAVLLPTRQRLGLGELRWAMSGAAPIAAETLDFFLSLGVTVCEIWGMSETAGAATVNTPERIRVGTVGQPLPGVELKIADDGEALLRGKTVMRGYRNDPELSAQALDVDGWLHTGDVVTVDSDGSVRIIDRKKEIMINAAGKNMSPAAVERAIKTACPLVGDVVAIADGRPFTTALVVLDPEALAADGLDDVAAATRQPEVVSKLLAGIMAANERLSRVEQVKRLRILPVTWTPGSLEVTPTMKLRRGPIAKKYAAEIESMYADSDPNVHDLRDVTAARP